MTNWICIDQYQPTNSYQPNGVFRMTTVSPLLTQFENGKNERIWIYTTMSESGADLMMRRFIREGIKVFERPIRMEHGLFAVMFQNPNWNGEAN